MPKDRDRVGKLDEGLKRMFQALARRPLPDAIASVVDQLDEGPAAREEPRRRLKA